MSIWTKITRTNSFRPAFVKIKPDHTDVADQLRTAFAPNEQYFLVTINEMYLSYKRKWFSEYDPLVFALSEFLYGGERVSVPYVVGPSLVKDKIGKVPDGMIMKDSIVAGLHPYRGGEISISVVLARLRQVDYLRRILKLIESTAGTYVTGFVTMISQYSKVANVVLEGIDGLLEAEEIEPLVGYRKTFGTGVDPFLPFYFVLVNKDEVEVNDEKFFVKDNSLLYGDTFENARPFREEDYVLYSIRSARVRTDTERLPFHKQWLELVGAIGALQELDDDDKQIINGKLFSLMSALETSPDLTRDQVDQLVEGYIKDRDRILARRSKRLSGFAEPTRATRTDPWEESMRNRSLQILKSLSIPEHDHGE